MPDKGGGFILSPCLRVQTVVVGEAWEQGWETAIGVVSEVRKQRDEYCSSTRYFSFACSGTPA